MTNNYLLKKNSLFNEDFVNCRADKTNLLNKHAYFGRDEQLKRFHSNTYFGFVRTAISGLVERFYQTHQHYLLSIFSL